MREKYVKLNIVNAAVQLDGYMQKQRLGFPRHCSTAASRRRCAPWLQPRYHQKLTAIYASATLKVYKGNCFRDELSFLLHSYIQGRDHVAATRWAMGIGARPIQSILSRLNLISIMYVVVHTVQQQCTMDKHKINAKITTGQPFWAVNQSVCRYIFDYWRLETNKKRKDAHTANIHRVS